MFDEYTLLTDSALADVICDGRDLDDVLHRFDYAEDAYVIGIKMNNIKLGKGESDD